MDALTCQDCSSVLKDENLGETTFKNYAELNGKFYCTKCYNKHLDKPTLNDLHATYAKWIKTKDYNRIDIVLATALTRATPGIPIWLIVVGASGDWKSVQLSALEHDGYSKLIGRITPKTLITGARGADDLAPKLSNKILLIKDMAQLLTMPAEAKAEVWAQLRDLFDGKMTLAVGTGIDKVVLTPSVTMIAASTPVIDEQLLIGQALGTREIIWRSDLKRNEETAFMESVMNQALENEEAKEEMERELNKQTTNYLTCHAFKPLKLDNEQVRFIKNLADFIRIMRAVGEYDFDGNLRNVVYPEMPTRILMQLKKLWQALHSLDENYPEEKVQDILRHLAKSNMHPLRYRVLSFLAENQAEEFTTNKVAHECLIGVKTANMQLNMLRSLGLTERIYTEEIDAWGKVREKITWRLKPGEAFDKIWAAGRDPTIAQVELKDYSFDAEKAT